MLGPAVYEHLLHAAGVPLFVDFDDAIWIPDLRGANGKFVYLRFAGKIASICRLSSGVVVGNEYLAAYARQHSAHVFVVPTSIDLQRYSLQPPPPNEPFTIVWSGSHSTLQHLECARAPIEAFGKRRYAVLRVIGNRAPDRPFANVDNVFIPWAAAGEAAEIGRAHVGIMPLPDTDYTRGKCALKALQYMALGLPTIVSPVGANMEVVEHGRTGLHATTLDEWVDALEKLASSRQLRTAIGRAGRETVEKRFSSVVASDKFAEAVRMGLRRARSLPRQVSG